MMAHMNEFHAWDRLHNPIYVSKLTPDSLYELAMFATGGQKTKTGDWEGGDIDLASKLAAYKAEAILKANDERNPG